MLKNCFNYVGSKDRILPIIDENLDKSKKTFIDLFCGSGVVGLNEINNYSKIVMNDACWQLTETLAFLKDSDYEEVINRIDSVISEYGLSKENKEGYDKLRDFYNNNCVTRESFDPVKFYCLLSHSFNYNIHINSSGGFSVPFGKNRSYFSSTLKTKLQLFQGILHANSNKVLIKNDDFFNVVKEYTRSLKGCMVYCDPPYLSSDSSYGRVHYLGKWDGRKEQQLCDMLDLINSKGGSFLLSNVLENNGNVNELLREWSKKYNIVYVNSDYTNCNYQRKNLGKTNEVLIRNY